MRVKRLLLILFWVIATPLLLFMVAAGLLYIPAVQDWAVNKVARAATEGTGLNVSVERVGLSWPLDLDTRGIVATNDEGDTLLSVRQAIIDLDLSGIFSSRLGVDNIELRQGYIDSKDLIEGLTVKGRIGDFYVRAPGGIDIAASRVRVGECSLSDCDISVTLGDMASEEDSATTALPWRVDIDRIHIDNIYARACIGDTMNIEARMRQTDVKGVSVDLDSARYDLQGLLLAMDYVVVDDLSLPSFKVEVDSAGMDGVSMRLARARLDISDTWLEAGGGTQAFERFDLALAGRMGKADVDSLLRYADLKSSLPDGGDMTFSARVGGDWSRICVPQAKVAWERIADLDMSAEARNPLGNDLKASLRADVRSFVGNARLDASYDNAREAYEALLDLTGVTPRAVVPDIPVRRVSASVSVSGQGMDVLSPATVMHARVSVPKLELDSLAFSDISMSADLERGYLSARMVSEDTLVRANMNMEGRVRLHEGRTVVDGTLGLDLQRVDLQGLHLVDSALAVGACIHVDAISNLTDRHRLGGTVRDILLIRPDTVLRPVDLAVRMMVHPDSLYAYFSAGAMYIDASTKGGLSDVMAQIEAFGAEVENQLQKHYIDQEVMRPLLPTADIHLHICGRNPVSTWLAMMGYTYDDIKFDLNSDPKVGLNGGGHIHALNTGVMVVDTIRWNIYQDSSGVKMKSQITNGPKNKTAVFDARTDFYMLGDGAGMFLTYTDKDGVKGVDLGAVAQLTPQGAKVQLMPFNPVIAYRRFKLNEDNYVFLSESGTVLANIDLLADDNTGLQVYSGVQLTDSLATDSLKGDQDLTLTFHHVNLGELSSVLPLYPSFGGLLAGDAHYIQQESMMTAAVDATIRNFVFEGSRVGDVGLNAVYLPDETGRHTVDGMMSLNGNECALFSGSYIDDGKDGLLDISSELVNFPLSVANGFVDKNLAQVKGALNGGLTIKGSTTDPLVNGALMMSGVKVTSNDYSLKLTVTDDTVRVKDNYLDFDRIEVYSTGKKPLLLDGFVDFRQMDKINVDMSMTAKNFELINAKENIKKRALAYGKVYCDVDAYMRGELSALHLGGTLKVLGKTDVTYVLRDSPLTVEDRLSDLVTFADFDHPEDEEQEAQTADVGVTMDFKLIIDDAAQVRCLLSEDKSSYVDVEGGGELLMTYSPAGDIMLNGRYTINSGEMKYELPVIPLKTFKFENGSYIAFKGKMLNPELNLTAVERAKALVTEEGQGSRSVAFDVGVKITQTLENMGLQFTIAAPEDATVQGELDTMDDAARGRIAVTMLVTGMYLSDTSGGSGFSATDALNSFLQSEISSIAGKALSSVDLTFGMENSTSATGATQTDYSFRFAKHFWGNRISVVLGGTVSSGSEAQNDGTTLVDNVSIEYRLDQGATRYVRVFYDKAYESLIDGRLTEMGAGLVLRRKTTRLGDLFLFRNSKKNAKAEKVKSDK